MKTIIFSKDRSCQLDLLLTSMQMNGNGLFDDVTVLWKASTIDFDRGYLKAMCEFPDVEFMEQGNFYVDVQRILADVYKPYTMCLVDDIIIYRPIDFDIKDVHELFTMQKELCCLSLRLGVNVDYLYQENRHMGQPRFEPKGKFLVWNRSSMSATENYNYPMSVDGHVFETHRLHMYVGMPDVYQNPNELESHLTLRWSPLVTNMMACPTKSVVVNSPINRVQDQFRNKYGTVFSYTPEGLNKKYLEGQKLDIYSMDFSNVHASHQEIEVSFK